MKTTSSQNSAQQAYKKRTQPLKRSATERHRLNHRRRRSRIEKTGLEVIFLGDKGTLGVPLLQDYDFFRQIWVVF